MSEIEKYYNGEIIVDFEEETELEKKYNEVAELYSKAVKKKIEYRKEIERLKAELELYENGVYYSSENDKLQERIDKAIEYIEQLPFNDLTPIEVKVIYKILQGSDKE